PCAATQTISGFDGWTMMREICSEVFRPVLVHDMPPSVLLYTPSPKPTCRPPTFSPVPTHTVFEFEGSIVTHPVEYDACWSKTGVHVTPALTVFHTPPDPTATNQVCSSRGSIATSAMRPAIRAGPMLRKANPDKISGLSRVSFFSASGFAAGLAFWAVRGSTTARSASARN